MKRPVVHQFFINHLYAILIAIAGFIFILMLGNYGGIGLSPDSITYTSVAKSLAAHGKLHQYDDAPFVDFPVGYPLFLSIIFKIAGTDYTHTGVYLNAVLFAILLLVCGLAVQRFAYTSAIYNIAVLICILVNPGLLEIYSMLWSETLFILLTALCMVRLHTYACHANLKNLLIAALTVALICIMRYAGIAFIAAGGIVVLRVKHQSLKQKFIHLLIFGGIAIALLAANLIRNYLVEGFATGEREKSITPLLSNIYYFGAVLCNWFSLPSDNKTLVIAFAIAVMILLAIAVLWHFIIQKDKPGFECITAVFAFTYSSFIIITASVSRFETIDSRFIAPAFIPLICTLAYWLNKTAIVAKHRFKVVLVCMHVFIAILLVAGEFNNSYASYNDIKDYGIPGYTDDDWRLSPTVQYLQAEAKNFVPDVEIYSNANDAVYFFTQKHAQQLPHKESPEEIQALLAEDAFYIVWFSATDDSDDVSLKYILQHRPMKLIKQFKDGAVYVTKSNAATNPVN